MAFEDVDLQRSEGFDSPPPGPRRGVMALVAVVVVVAAAAAGWWWLRPSGQPDAAAPAAGPPPSSPPPAAARPPAPLPGLEALDPVVRQMIAGLTSSPLLSRWLATDDLARQIVALVGATGGQTPLRLLAPLRPGGSFSVVQRQGRTTIDPATYRRMDPLAEVIASLDPGAVAAAYRRLSPRLEDAYAELGHDRSFDQALRESLDRLINTPVPDGPIRVTGRAGVYFYTDPKLEALAPSQKLLLRSGPDNARRVQAQLRAIRAALDSPAAPTP